MTKSMKMQLKHTAKTSNETNMKTTSKFGQTSTANPTLCLGIHAQAESKVVYSSTRVKLPNRSNLRNETDSYSASFTDVLYFDSNAQVDRGWRWLVSFVSKGLSLGWSNSGTLLQEVSWGLESHVFEVRTVQCGSSHQTLPWVLSNVHQQPRCLGVFHQCVRICETMWDLSAVMVLYDLYLPMPVFTTDRESTMPQRVFTLFPFLQCTPISLDKLQSFWTDTHLDSVSWEQWW